MVYVQEILDLMRICVIIPAYNEAKAIGGLVKQIREFCPEVLIIDDGSSDNTASCARENGAIVLRNPVNLGKGASLIIGFKHILAKDYDAAIIMDGDGQHSPEDIPLFLEFAAPEEKKFIVGNRMNEAVNMPLVRVLTNKFMSWLISSIIKQKVVDTQCGFRLIKREVLDKLNLRTSKYEIESEMLTRASSLGFKIDSMPVKTIYRGEKSQINPVTDTVRFFRFIIRELWSKT